MISLGYREWKFDVWIDVGICVEQPDGLVESHIIYWLTPIVRSGVLKLVKK